MREIPIRNFITKKEGYVQEFDGVNLTGTTWIIPKTHGNITAKYINFTCKEYPEHTYKELWGGAQKEEWNAYSFGYRLTWDAGYIEMYQSLTITILGGSDVTNSSFISWLQSSATFVPRASYTYNVEIAGANSYGEGPKTAIELNLTSVPFTINRQEFIFEDKNGWYLTSVSDGAPSDEILKCGQILTITYLPGLTGRLFPKNEQLLTANNADVVTEVSEDQKSLTVTVSNITGPIDFMFTDFKHSIPLTIYDLEGKVANKLITNANTWQEVVDDETNDLFAMDGMVYMWGRDQEYHQLLWTSYDGSYISCKLENSILADKEYYIYLDTRTACDFKISKDGSVVLQLTKKKGTKTFAQLAQEDTRFYCDESRAYYVENNIKYPLTRRQRPIYPDTPITEGYYWTTDPVV